MIGSALSTALRKPGPSVAGSRGVADRSPRAVSLILTGSYSMIRTQPLIPPLPVPLGDRFYRLAASSELGVGYTGILYLYSQLLSTRSTSLS